jgi:hypothetical protein
MNANDLPGTGEAARREVENLAKLRVELEGSLADGENKIASLESQIADRERLITALNQKLASESQKVASLNQAVESALDWQRRSWFKRAFHRWRPPGQQHARKGILKRLTQSLGKRFDEIKDIKSRTLELIATLKRAMRKKGRLEIEVITMIYNEAFLAPLFVRHYAPWVDKFTVFYSESTDGTRHELERAAAECGVKRLKIVPFEYPNGMDDIRRIERINQAVRESSADFVVCVDTDEFVHPWPFENANPRDELAKESGDVVYCAMVQSYRHVTDVDVDRSKPPLFQRRHGVTDFFINQEGKQVLLKDIYTKPCIVRPDSGAQFLVGLHGLKQPKRGSTQWRGAHWVKADVFCVSRCVRDRRDRLSEKNLQNNYGVQYFSVTEEKILADLKAHENDPKLF